MSNAFLGLDAVLVRGLERAKEAHIANLRFVSAYVADIRDFFADGELDGIYLNFSDPWPKPRHEKRRFTTEYEDKFSGKGKNINYVKIRF